MRERWKIVMERKYTLRHQTCTNLGSLCWSAWLRILHVVLKNRICTGRSMPWGEKMQQEHPAATMMLKDICKLGCKRCAKFERAESASSLTRLRGRRKNSHS
jgi:hypothetical protein